MTPELALVTSILATAILVIGLFLGRVAPVSKHPPVRPSPWLAYGALVIAFWVLRPVMGWNPWIGVLASCFLFVGPLGVALIRELVEESRK